MGPSKGIPDNIRAADTQLIASTSWGLTRSAPSTVPTTWTSLRNPAGNEGRRGRSIKRSVKMAWSVALPSRRKKEPGIFPAAYMRSSTSTVSGKKSVPSLTARDTVAVTRIMVSPIRPTTAPSAWPASLPVSKLRVRSVPLIAPDTAMASAILGLLSRADTLPGQFPVVNHLPAEDLACEGPLEALRAPLGRTYGRGDRQLAADRLPGALFKCPGGWSRFGEVRLHPVPLRPRVPARTRDAGFLPPTGGCRACR